MGYTKMTKALNQENVFRCLTSKLGSNEYNLFEIVGFIDNSRILVKNWYYFYDKETGNKRYKSKKPKTSKNGKYNIRTKEKRYEIDIEDLKVEGRPAIDKKTRAGIHKAINGINKRLLSLASPHEKDYQKYRFIVKPKENTFRIEESKFFNWLEKIIEDNYSYSDKKDFLRWLKENLLSEDASLKELSKGAFYTKSKTGKHPLLLINPVIILNRVYVKNGKMDLKMKSKEVYLRLLEFLISLMSQKHEFIRLNTQNPR